MKVLFESLQGRIGAVTAVINGVEQACFKYIDQDLGQLDVAGRQPVAWPCVLIDFDDFVYSALGQNCERGTGNIVLRMGFPSMSGSSSITPSLYKDKALYYYDLEALLHQALQGWKPADDYAPDAIPVALQGFGALCRTHCRTIKRKDNVRLRELIYSIGFEDYSTKPEGGTAPAVIHIVMAE